MAFFAHCAPSIRSMVSLLWLRVLLLMLQPIGEKRTRESGSQVMGMPEWREYCLEGEGEREREGAMCIVLPCWRSFRQELFFEACVSFVESNTSAAHCNVALDGYTTTHS